MDCDLYVITDRGIGRGRPHEEIARLAIAGGAGIIQLRDKICSKEDLIRTGRTIAAIARDSGTLFIVNDRPDLAIACGAGGVHLGQDDMPAAIARKTVPEDFIIGVSVCTPAQAVRAEKDGADYLAASPVFPTGSKPDAKSFCGIDGIRRIRAVSQLPLIAIGGITKENACDVILAGADGIAVISAVVGEPDIAAAAKGLLETVRQAKEQKRRATRSR